MKVTSQQTEKLLNGIQKFQLFAFSMMLTHLKELYLNDPSQPMLEKCTAEINAFLGKYHTIMAADYAVIEQL